MGDMLSPQHLGGGNFTHTKTKLSRPLGLGKPQRSVCLSPYATTSHASFRQTIRRLTTLSSYEPLTILGVVLLFPKIQYATYGACGNSSNKCSARTFKPSISTTPPALDRAFSLRFHQLEEFRGAVGGNNHVVHPVLQKHRGIERGPGTIGAVGEFHRVAIIGEGPG